MSSCRFPPSATQRSTNCEVWCVQTPRTTCISLPEPQRYKQHRARCFSRWLSWFYVMIHGSRTTTIHLYNPLIMLLYGSGLEKLAYLYLDHNRIASLPTAVFRPLVSIYAIYIRRNSLVALRSDSMEGLERLRWLYVTGNRLVKSRDVNDLWRNIHAILGKDIIVSSHRLTHIDDNALESCSSLQRLYLGSNELSEFPARGLAGKSKGGVCWNCCCGLTHGWVVCLIR